MPLGAALARMGREYTAAEVAEFQRDPLWRGRVRYGVWAPGRPWHGCDLSYPEGGDWRRPLVAMVGRHRDAEIERAA